MTGPPHHDGAAKGPKPIGFGNCWVVAGIVVGLSFLSRPVCLPVPARLWRPQQAGKIAHARELAELIAARYSDRTVHVVGDAAYVGERLRDMDDRIRDAGSTSHRECGDRVRRGQARGWAGGGAAHRCGRRAV